MKALLCHSQAAIGEQISVSGMGSLTLADT